jgi:hypothetical protein
MLLISLANGINTNMTTFFSYWRPQTTTHKTFRVHFLGYKACLYSLKNMELHLQFHNLYENKITDNGELKSNASKLRNKYTYLNKTKTSNLRGLEF